MPQKTYQKKLGSFPDKASADDQAELFAHWNRTHTGAADKRYDYKVKMDPTGRWYVYYTFA